MTRLFKRKSGRPLTDGINGLYTHRGYHDLFAPEADRVVRYVGDNDTWALGSSQLSMSELATAVANGCLTLEVKNARLGARTGPGRQQITGTDSEGNQIKGL